MAVTDERIDPLLRAAALPTDDELGELDRVEAALFGAAALPQFGRHRTVRRIGAGGLGVVWLAHDPELDRAVAIKSIARRLGPHARVQARMRREAQALARLRHPHVVTVYDVGIADDGLFIAMEYVDGCTFTEWLAVRPRRWQEIVAVVADAGSGLAAAHEAGVIHRDVKPSNILVDREGRARVVDFGLAFADVDPRGRAASAPSELTQTGVLLGTPAYMAPEQFHEAELDARTDQWGLAVTLHEALAGARPFVGDDLESTRTAVLQGVYRPSAGPAHVRVALARALQRDPADRFPDIASFVAALGRPRRASSRIVLGATVAATLALAATQLEGAPRPRAHSDEASRGHTDAATRVDEAAVQVTELRATWATPNAVRWSWRALGRADELRDYELVVGPSVTDVLVESDACRVFTRADNPELGHFLLPRTGGADPVLATITDGHEPDTAVFARLTAIDTVGRRHASNVASIHTSAPPVAEIVVFADERPHGFPIPALEVSDARPFAGTHHLQFVSDCRAPHCFANLRWQDLRIALDGLTPGDWATTAYLELAVAVDGEATSWWSQLRVWFDGSAPDRVGHFNSFALRSDGEYRVLQVPLRAFTFTGDPAPAEHLRHGLFELGLGGWWSPRATVRIDEIRIRW